jgi:hypothetical protein
MVEVKYQKRGILSILRIALPKRLFLTKKTETDSIKPRRHEAAFGNPERKFPSEMNSHKLMSQGARGAAIFSGGVVSCPMLMLSIKNTGGCWI